MASIDCTQILYPMSAICFFIHFPLFLLRIHLEEVELLGRGLGVAGVLQLYEVGYHIG